MNINQNNLNNALKELYYTNYFKNVKLSLMKMELLNINVKENPIIQIS